MDHGFDQDEKQTCATSDPYFCAVFPQRNATRLLLCRLSALYAKASPGKINLGSAGTGNMTHIAGELFNPATARF
jgi:hypothetical protein